MFAKTREISVKDGEEFVLHPGVSVIAVSKEFFGSDHFLIQIGGKSSLARVGLMIHNTAGIINPGHFLNVTLELSNQNNVPIIIRPGMAIAQIMFSMLSSPPSQSYRDVGRFAKDNWKHFAGGKEKQCREEKTCPLLMCMHTHPEYQYLELLKEILKNGDRKVDRGLATLLTVSLVNSFVLIWLTGFLC